MMQINRFRTRVDEIMRCIRSACLSVWAKTGRTGEGTGGVS